MTKRQIRVQARYWYLSARHDYETMIGLFKIRRYSDTLFYVHIVLEKILKALVIVEFERAAPLTHDLIALVGIIEAKGNAPDKEFLRLINRFNIRARYPDYKLKFYKICDRSYTFYYLNRAAGLYKKLCQHPKLKSLLSDLVNY